MFYHSNLCKIQYEHIRFCILAFTQNFHKAHGIRHILDTVKAFILEGTLFGVFGLRTLLAGFSLANLEMGKMIPNSIFLRNPNIISKYIKSMKFCVNQ